MIRSNTVIVFSISLLLSSFALLFVGIVGVAQAANPYTIVAVGDWDCNADTKKTVENIQKQNPNIVLSLGDMSYTSKADCWLEEIAPLKDKMLISQGNHDGNYDDYMSAMGVTGLWYSKAVPEANALFVSVNTEESLKEGSEQLAFIEKAFTDSKAAWKIAFMHKPSITYGHHSSDEGAPETLLPLYDKLKVSMEISGHNHFMQEIFPTTGSDGTPHKVAAGEGTVHIVSGGGGRDLYDFEENEVVAQSKADHGIVKVTLLDTKNAKAEFISNDGTVIPLADIVNRNTVGTIPPPEPPVCKPTEHIENGVCVPNPPPQPPVDPICGPNEHIENHVCVPDVVIPPPPPPITNQSQIVLNNLIQSTTSTGEYKDPDYIAQYNVNNLFDNLINTYSFWSQKGQSSFEVILNQALKTPLCSIEFDVYNPANQKYNFKAIDTESELLLDFNGTLDASKEIVNINGCVSGVKQFGMQFTPAIVTAATSGIDKWTILSEMKLFTNSTTQPPPIEVCDQGYHYDPITKTCVKDTVPPPPPVEPPIPPVGNGTINITNSTVPISIDNANITINTSDNVRNETDTNNNNNNEDGNYIDLQIPELGINGSSVIKRGGGVNN